MRHIDFSKKCLLEMWAPPYCFIWGLSSSVAKQRTVTRKISYFELGFFYFNSCVCYVTRAFSLLTRGFELETPGFEIVTCRLDLVTRISELLNRVLVSCGCFWLHVFKTVVTSNLDCRQIALTMYAENCWRV